jgi:hypothetical protein
LLLAGASAAPAQGTCTPEAQNVLCLLDGRLAVSVSFRNQYQANAEGVGKPEQWTNKAGGFWFFRPDNLEVVVKALDGRSVNDAFWVYIGAMSDLDFVVVVTDTTTGNQRRYVNQPGNVWGVRDTTAFLDDDNDDGGNDDRCGGPDNLSCTSDQSAERFCEFAKGTCGTEAAFGVCEQVPEGCPTTYDPVCGCNLITYANDCVRRNGRVPLLRLGSCDQGLEGEQCAGILGTPCSNDPDLRLYCRILDASCDAPDAGGVCTQAEATCSDVPAPVCGCDRVTYANECTAHQAGQDVLHFGACR